MQEAKRVVLGTGIASKGKDNKTQAELCTGSYYCSLWRMEVLFNSMLHSKRLQ